MGDDKSKAARAGAFDEGEPSGACSAGRRGLLDPPGRPRRHAGSLDIPLCAEGLGLTQILRTQARGLSWPWVCTKSDHSQCKCQEDSQQGEGGPCPPPRAIELQESLLSTHCEPSPVARCLPDLPLNVIPTTELCHSAFRSWEDGHSGCWDPRIIASQPCGIG